MLIQNKLINISHFLDNPIHKLKKKLSTTSSIKKEHNITLINFIIYLHYFVYLIYYMQ